MLRSKTTQKIRWAVVFLITTLITGVTGYMLIEDFSFVDALYMTVITVSTVGFREVGDLTSGGQVFTILLIMSSLLTFAYAISVITSHFVEGEISFALKGYRTRKSTKKMNNHTIICGYGRNGRQAASELAAFNQGFVVIDQSQDVIKSNNTNGISFIHGDATEDKTLENAGIMKARALITTFPIDADNLFVAITAKTLNPNVKIISRASNDSAERKLRMAGVHYVVMPEKVGGSHMADLVVRRDVVEFLEHLSVHSDAPTNLDMISCNELPDKACGKTIYEMGVRKKTGANIVGIKTPDGEFVINPNAEVKLVKNSILFVLGTPGQIEEMKGVIRTLD